jgi:sugar phosphate isomerase/epimerase
MTPRLAFSTLACPEWTIETIIARAREMGYDGIEWRGGAQGHVPLALSPQQRINLRERMRDANLFSLAVTAYTRFVSDDASDRAANVDDLKRQLDLAAEIGAQYVRTFLGELETGQTFDDVYPRVIESVSEVVPHANDVGVGIAIEHHDSFVRTSSIVPILSQRNDDALGAVWDIANAWSAGESPEEGARNLQNRISYVQVKDGRGQNENWKLTNVGEGEVPLKRAMELLRELNYPGALSVEWEYTWHRDLEPPERALPRALGVVRELAE